MGWVKGIKHWFGVDFPISITVGGRVVNSLVSPVALTFLSTDLTKFQLGYYYTFASVFALQSFLELGFFSCVSHVASRHYYNDIARADDDHHEIRLLLSYAFGYALALALAVFILVGGFGWMFISHGQADAGGEFGPWLCFLLASCLKLCLNPMFSIWDGCNKIPFAATVRVLGLLCSNLFLCVALKLGFGLYASSVAVMGLILPIVGGLAWKYSHLIRGLPSLWREAWHRWHRAILPFQGKIAVTTFCSYFHGSFFAPFLLSFCGPEAAGRFGLTMAALHSITDLTITWTSTKIGVYGKLAQSRKYDELFKLFRRTLAQSSLIALGGILVLLTADVSAHDHFAMFSRMSPLADLMMMSAGVLTAQFILACSSLFRANGQERLVRVNVLHTSVLLVLLFSMVPLFAVHGAVLAQFISYLFAFTLTGIAFFNFKREMLE